MSIWYNNMTDFGDPREYTDIGDKSWVLNTGGKANLL